MPSFGKNATFNPLPKRQVTFSKSSASRRCHHQLARSTQVLSAAQRFDNLVFPRMVLHLKWKHIKQHASANISNISKYTRSTQAAQKFTFLRTGKAAILYPFSKATPAHRAALFRPFLSHCLCSNTSVANFENEKINLQVFQTILSQNLTNFIQERM